MKKRIMLEILYGVPSMWSIDMKHIQEWETDLKGIYEFFMPFHKEIATLPLTKFEWLTSDKLVQQTQFGDQVKVTANFSNKTFNKIPSKSIELKWIKKNKRKIFTP